MDATQAISDSILESDEEEHKEENRNKRGRPLAKLCILKNPHIPETELPLFLGDNILGRDPNTCALPLAATSVSKQHATICISVYRRRGVHSQVDMEALVWDLGSMNGTRKGRLKLTPNVRYALSEGDSLVFADIPCQYVGCGGVSSQNDTKTPGSRRSGAKDMSDASEEKRGDGDTSRKNGVNGGAKAKKTPVRGSCLSLEQTPTQPEGSLVPESDSDSDSEGDDGGGRQHKTQVSDSDSHKSSPNSSAFLSPPNKIVPESEDESPITLLSSSRSTRHVSFSTEKTDDHMERNKSPAFVENSGEEDKRAAQGGTTSKESDQHVKQKNNMSFTGEDESPVSTSEVSRDAIPEFNMDSDTDVEGEEEDVVVPPRPLSLNTSQHADQPPNAVHFDIDSDTDIDEDEDNSDKPSKTPSDETTKPSHVASGIRPEDITMDSDTDVDDDGDVAVSDAVITAKASSCQDAHTADSASLVQPKDFHLDSDTDVDEEDEGEFGMKNNTSKTNKAFIESDVKPVMPECIPAAPQNLHSDTDTINEAVCVPAACGPSEAPAVVESCITAAAGADLDIQSDGDTETEDDSLLVIPLAVTDLSVVPDKTSEALKSDSDEDTDVDEPCMPPTGDIPADLRVDSDTDVEDEEGNIGEAGEDKIPDLQRKHTVGSLVPTLQNCSTPVWVSEGEVEDMETQAFTSPSSGAFRCAEASALKPAVPPCLSDSESGEDYAVAETQSFVLLNRDQQADMDPNTASTSESKAADRSSRGDSFQLGLSDSSHQQSHSGALAMESTQAFVSAEGVNLEETQAYEAISNPEATQVYEEDEEPVGDSEVSEKEGCVNLAFEATQAYVSQPYSDSNEDSDEAKRQNAAMTKTTDLTDPSSTLAMAETQPVPSFEEEQSLETNNPTCSVLHAESRILNETEEKEAAQPQQKHLSVAETQPMCMSDNKEGSDEDLSTSSQLKEEQTQPNACSALSLAETQPMSVEETQPVVLSENDEEDSMPLLRKRKAKQLQIEEEESQKLSNSGVCTAETQPIVVTDNDDDDDSDSMPGPRKRKAKPLQLEDETQSLVNSEVSAVDFQPLATCEGERSDEEDFILHSKKRKASPLQLEEEQTQPLISSEVSGITTPVEDGNEENDSEVLVVPRKRKAKQLHLEEEETQQLMSSELSTAETQPACEGEEVDMMAGPQIGETNPLQRDEEQTLTVTTEVSDVDRSDHKGSIIVKQHNLKEEEMQPVNSEVSPGETLFKATAAETSEPSVSNSRQTRARLREKVEEAECSAPSKRQTRRESKTLPSTRGGRGKAMTHHDNSEEEVKQSKQTGGRKSTRQQEDKSKIIVTKSLIKDQKHINLEEKGDTAEFREEKRETTDNERIETGVRKGKQKEMEREKRNELKNEGIVNEKQDRELEEVEGDGEEIEEKQGLKKESKKNEQMEIKEERSEESLETTQRDQEERCEGGKKEQEHQARLEKEKPERKAKEKQPQVSKEKGEEEKQKIPARGRRSTQKTTQCTTEPEQNSAVSASEDFPARRTRSCSNSSNSVSSERSVSAINTQDTRGRGAKRSSETLQTIVVRSSRRRMTAAVPREQDSEDRLFRSNSSSSISSEIFTCSGTSQNRARGGRRQGRGRKTLSDCHVVAPVMVDIDQNPTGKVGKKGMAERSSPEDTDNKKKGDAQQIGTSRGQQQVNANVHGLPSQEKGFVEEKSLLPRRNSRGRGQNAGQTDNMEEPVVPPVSDGYAARNKRKGRKSELEVNTKADSSNVFKGKTLKTMTEDGENEQKEENTVQVRRTSRVSSAQVKKNAKESPPEEEVEDGENMEVKAAEKKARSRTSVVQKNKKEQKEIGTSASSTKQDTNEASEQPHTPTSTVPRKRQASSDSPPVAKTPRSSSGSPAAISRLRAGSQSYKVLFTGVMDEAGERVLARLGGSMAKGLADMNCLVTDKVRRTVKFLCAVAKGIPVVTPDWLEKSGKAGSFLSPNDFVVKDPEQEKKFSFCLQESLRTSRSQPLLQGYEIHVTKSVKPEPVHMKDIISCSGATFLPRMPSSHKPQTVVISCEEDWRLCGPAVSASLPVVTAEFILTGILQQKLDFHTHALSSTTTANSQPAENRGRTRRKT